MSGQVPQIYDNHIINVLTDFYLDKHCMKVYNGRWHTWLCVNNYMDEYFYMMMRTDFQVANILKQAYQRAQDIKNSPLGKALNEEE